MKHRILGLALLVIVFSCKLNSKMALERPMTKSISIFEIYLEDSVAVDHFSNFLRDTLKLPVEWEPFDFFGNGVVYDAAFYLGNTTLELLAVNPPDSNISAPARYNRILFRSENIDSTASAIRRSGMAHKSPFDFKITSNNSDLIIGKQINLDSISSLSNVHIAFWEYVNSGYDFAERTIKGDDLEDLNSKLDKALISNPMGIIGLKEVHLSLEQKAIDEWHMLLGASESNRWVLAKGPVISFSPSIDSIGADRITIKVQSLEAAKNFLSQNALLAVERNKILIDPSKIYGLRIYIEE